MSSKTKIVVLHLKELIYTGIFVVLGILFIILLVIMFLPDKKAKDTENRPSETVPSETQTQPQTGTDSSTVPLETSYIPGVYTTTLTLNDHSVDVEVVVDSSNINSVRLVNLEEAVTTMFPLLQPSFDALAEQIYTNQTLDGITYAAESKYTSLVLLQAIDAALQKAIPSGATVQ